MDLQAGRVKGQAGQGLLHFLQPGVEECASLLSLLFLVTFDSFDRQIYFLMLGPCLNDDMGGSSNIVFSSGLVNNMDL